MRSEEDRIDITSRQLANLDWSAVEVAVDPAMFSGSGTLAAFDDAFASMDKVVKPSMKQIGDADRVVGGIAMAFNAVQSVQELAVMTNLLAGAGHTGKRYEGILAFLAGGRLRTFSKSKQKNPDSESVLFEAAVETIVGIDPNVRWSAESVLAEIWDRVAVASTDVADEFRALFDYMFQVIRIERDLVPFKHDAPTVPKALLMFLLRPLPDDVSTWRSDIYDVGQPEFVAASVLSGLLIGYAQLPVSLRHGDLERLLGIRQAGVLNRGLSDAFQVETLVNQEVKVNFQIGRFGSGVISSTLGEHPVFQVDVDASLSTLLLETDLEPDWSSLLQLVRDVEWGDSCIRTTLDGPLLPAKKGASEIVLRGYIEPSYSVDISALREAVAEHGVPARIEGVHRARIVSDIDAMTVRLSEQRPSSTDPLRNTPVGTVAEEKVDDVPGRRSE